MATALSVESHTALQTVTHLHAQITVDIDPHHEERARRRHIQTPMLQEQIVAARGAQHTGEEMEAATEDAQEHRPWRIPLEETCAQDRPCLGLGGTQDLLWVVQGRHL